MFEYKYVSEGENNKHRKSDLDIGPLQKDSRPTWVHTAAKGHYKQMEKLQRTEKSKLAKKAVLQMTKSEAINYNVNITWNNDSASKDEATYRVE